MKVNPFKKVGVTMKLQQAPLLRLYRLSIDPQDRTEFVQAGAHNLLTSIAQEPGTLAMGATHQDVFGATNYIFELYRDDEHYQVHAQSPQFRQYQQVAQRVVHDKMVLELTPQVLRSQATALRVSGSNDLVVRGLFLTAKPGQTVTIRQRVRERVDRLAFSEPDTLAVYAATVATDEAQWVILEVYRNAHAIVSGDHDLAHTLADVVTQQFSRHLAPDGLVTQGSLSFE